MLLDENAATLDPSLVPSISTTRIAAIGLGDDGPVSASLQNVGLSRRPPMPIWPRSTVSADGTLELCWTRRARGQWRWEGSSEMPLVEEQELYLVGFGPVDSPHIAWNVASPQFTLSPAEQAQAVVSHGVGELWVRQIGTYSQSSALHLFTLS